MLRTLLRQWLGAWGLLGEKGGCVACVNIFEHISWRGELGAATQVVIRLMTVIMMLTTPLNVIWY